MGIILAILIITTLVLVLDIQQTKADSIIYIRPDGSVDPPTTSIKRNGNLYTLTDNVSNSIVNMRSNIIFDGNSYAIQGSGWMAGAKTVSI